VLSCGFFGDSLDRPLAAFRTLLWPRDMNDDETASFHDRLTKEIADEPDEAKRAQIREWFHRIVSIGAFGHEAAGDQFGDSGIQALVARLRSGQPLTGPAAKALAELIDCKEEAFGYRLSLVPVRKRVKQFDRGADAIEFGLEIQRLIDSGLSINQAVALFSERIEVDERTMWRYWKQFKRFYPSAGRDPSPAVRKLTAMQAKLRNTIEKAPLKTRSTPTVLGTKDQASSRVK
jgi:hypothetical protein